MFLIADDPPGKKLKDAADRPYENRYGKFYGRRTIAAVKAFRAENHIEPVGSGETDAAVLKKLLEVTPVRPLASRIYVSRALDMNYTGFTEVASIIALGETNGRFDVTTNGYDKAGQSFSLLQWAQSQERLTPVFERLATDHEELMKSTFGEDTLASIRAFLAKPRGGLKKDGTPADAADAPFDLTLPTYRRKLELMARVPAVQKTLLKQAAGELRADKHGFDAISTTALSTVRGVALLLDLSNQFGPVVRKWYRKAAQAGLSGVEPVIADMLVSIDARIDSAAAKYHWKAKTTANVKKSRRNRIRFFRFSEFLADTPFTDT
jgi:hypothetical protein